MLENDCAGDERFHDPRQFHPRKAGARERKKVELNRSLHPGCNPGHRVEQIRIELHYRGGDRDTDLQFAEGLGIRGLRVSRDGPRPSRLGDPGRVAIAAESGDTARCLVKK